jgi:tRNA(fMet)-specific endonuclease VapC
MILLDTDHVSLLQHGESERYDRLIRRMDQLPPEVSPVISVITVEEQMRGWLAVIAKERQSRRQVAPYRELVTLFDFFSRFAIVGFDEHGASKFDELRKAKIRIGTMDLKIAAIALANHAVLLRANRRDFEKVPGLQIDNWAD